MSLMKTRPTIVTARHHATGAPVEVVALENVPAAAPAAGEVRVRMLYAPINPADLNMIEGKYGTARPLPDVPGNEGCGQVVEVGPGVPSSWEGRHVLVASRTWAREGVWAVDDLIPVPAGLAPQRACVLRVNPPTAWCLLHDFVALRAGETILQNAATSGVGRAVIEIAAHHGWSTLNVVRRPEAADDLRTLGADLVLADEADLAAVARTHLGGTPVRLGLNAVGGVSATRLAGLLGPGGTLVTYGAMSKEALKIPNGFLIFRDLVFRGFWLTRRLREMKPADQASLFGEIFRLAAAGCFCPVVAGEFGLEELPAALALATSGTVRGKVLLRLDA